EPRDRRAVSLQELITDAIEAELTAGDIAVYTVIGGDSYLNVAADDQPPAALFFEHCFGLIGNGTCFDHFDAVRLDQRRNRVLETDEGQLDGVGDGVPRAEIEMHVVKLVEGAEEIADAESRAAPHTHARELAPGIEPRFEFFGGL